MRTALPPFYDPEKVGILYTPQTDQAAMAGLNAGLTPAHHDTHRRLLLLVDTQVDFVHVDGALSVPGAVDDTRRTVEWIYRHVEQITAIAASLDSHTPVQIFFPTWWVGPEGKHPAPFTVITASDVRAGHWQPLFEAAWSRRYVEELEAQTRKQLMIWPFHTMIGSPGHAITPALYEAIVYHATARQARPHFLQKGTIPSTEYYSILEPEVKVPQHPEGTLNTAFLALLSTFDSIYVAGQAKSHCVLETLASVMRHFADRPDEISKWHILTDAMSSVAHPDIDFEGMAQEAFARFEARGMHLTTTTDAP